jgi:hypothetical protein
VDRQACRSISIALAFYSGSLYGHRFRRSRMLSLARCAGVSRGSAWTCLLISASASCERSAGSADACGIQGPWKCSVTEDYPSVV